MGGSERKILSVYVRVLSNDNALFWSLQLFGWTGISLLTYLSLSVPYDQYELAFEISEVVLAETPGSADVMGCGELLADA
jgi:hypothetical protein